VLPIPQQGRYRSRDWLHNLVMLPNSATLKRIRNPVMTMTLWSAVVCALHAHPRLRLPPMPALPHSLLGSALSLLLVFRTNSAYTRFWEGRAIWENVVNRCREFSRMASLYADCMGTGRLREMTNLLCAFPIMLKEHVQGRRGAGQLLMQDSSLRDLEDVANRPLFLINKLGLQARRPAAVSSSARSPLTRARGPLANDDAPNPTKPGPFSSS
jgi:predicted membrane chloride channel (bestrophin family)